LQGAFLRGADLQGADLQGANLQGADLQGAFLRGAFLQGAFLQGAFLRGADLQGADLRGADLRGAFLRGAFLRGANLQEADLQGANLQGADLREAKNIPALAASQLTIVPTEGSFIGWKQCRGGIILKLFIPADAKRSNGTERKCRAEFVQVLEIEGEQQEAFSTWDGGKTSYKVGEITRCNKWEEDRWITCGGGIHFYLTREEALNH